MIKRRRMLALILVAVMALSRSIDKRRCRRHNRDSSSCRGWRDPSGSGLFTL